RVQHLVMAIFGEESWQATNARLAIDNVRRRMSLGDDQQRLLDKIREAESAALAQGQNPAATERWGQVRKLAEAFWGYEHAATAKYFDREAASHQFQGQFIQAGELYESSLRIRAKVLGAEHPDYVATLGRIAEVHAAVEEYEDSIRFYEEAVRRSRRIWGAEHRRYAALLTRLGVVQHRMGEMDQSELSLGEAFSILQQNMDQARLAFAETSYNLGAFYFDQNDLVQAVEFHQFALDAYIAEVGLDHDRTWHSMDSLAAVYMAQQDYLHAEQLLDEVATSRAKCLGDRHALTVRTQFRLAVALGSQGKYDSAEPLFLRVLQIQRADSRTEPTDLRKTSTAYAALLERTGRAAEANALLTTMNSSSTH
ncbi:MAG: tetratricopeptide repeat protein, partial [Pirellulaceae bacterium]|nr:tetratricopeptide repeat protein [Pirellulaceae bacterium]